MARAKNAKEKSSYSLSIFHMISVSLILPTLILIVLQSYQHISSTQIRIAKNIRTNAQESEIIVSQWVSKHVNATRVVAELGSRYPISPSTKFQEALQQIHELFPDFHNIFLADASATTIAFHPAINEKGESTVGINFVDRQWFKHLSHKLQPVISGVFMGRGVIFEPIFSISVPVLVEGRLSHFGLGAINLEKMAVLFKWKGVRRDLTHTIIDHNNNIVFSTDSSRKPLTRFNENDSTQNIEVISDVFLRIPGSEKNISKMSVWKDASYYVKHSIQGTPWTLLVEYPVGPLQSNLYHSTIMSLGTIAVIYVVMIVLAGFFSKLLTRPIKSLSLVSKDIPQKIDNGEQLFWPHTNISEVSELIENYTLMAKTLKNRLWETRERYKVLVDISPSGIWTADLSGNLNYVSSKWNEITGIKHQCIKFLVSPHLALKK